MRNLKVDVSWIIFPLCIIWPFCWEALRISVSLLGKESACSAGDPGLTPGLGRSAGKRIGYLLQGFPGGSEVKASACNAGDLGLIPGSGRSPGEGNGNPLQYSCLENSMNRGAWWATVHRVAKSETRLSDLTYFPRWLNGQNPPANVGDSSTPGSGRSPGEGNCNQFQ